MPHKFNSYPGKTLIQMKIHANELSAALQECADDLEAEIEARRSGELPRRIERDLESVRRARELLLQAERSEGGSPIPDLHK